MLTTQSRQTLLTLARERITAALLGRQPNYPPCIDELEHHAGAFVTLHLRRGQERTLRGCIGQIAATGPLYDTVVRVAASAAFHDPRFPPLDASELGSIEIEISVLSALQRIHDPQLVRPGTHGLVIELGSRSGLLLPQVAAERGWDRDTFLAQTCRKAGLPPDAWQDERTHLSVFTAEVFDEVSLRM